MRSQQTFYSQKNNEARQPLKNRITRQKRFNRSHSGSKQASRASSQNQNCELRQRMFFKDNQIIKNIDRKSIIAQGIQIQATRRGSSFNHSRNNNRKQCVQSYFQLKILKLEKRCIDLQEQNNQKNKKRLQLQLKISALESQLNHKIKDTCLRQTTHLISNTLTKKKPENYLQKLKNKITETKNCQNIITIQGLQNKIKILQSQNNIFKTRLHLKQQELNSLQQTIKKKYQQRQKYINEVIADLQMRLFQKNQQVKNVQTQLDMFILKISRRRDNLEESRNDEIHNLRLRYQNLLQKYQNSQKQFKIFKYSKKYQQQTLNRKDSDTCSLSLSP